MIDDESPAVPALLAAWRSERMAGFIDRDGAGPVPAEISEAVAAFLRSPHASRLYPDRSGPDAAIACELLTRVRAQTSAWWSWPPRIVADILVEWGPPRSVSAPVEDVVLVLRSLVRYGHDRCATHESATARTLALVDALGMYLRTWDGHRHHYPESSPEEDRLGRLVRSVGGGAALLGLDVQPFPDEPLALAGVSPGASALVERLSAAIDAAMPEDAHAEVRTVCRRALARLGRDAPRALLRRASEANTAAGVVFAVGQLNGFVGRAAGQWSLKDLGEWFGAQNPSHRGTTLLHELTGRRWDRHPSAGPDLMTSTRRTDIVAERDVLLEILRSRGVDVTARALDDSADRRWSRSRYADPYDDVAFYRNG